jgi:hypothetical protein
MSENCSQKKELYGAFLFQTPKSRYGEDDTTEQENPHDLVIILHTLK